MKTIIINNKDFDLRHTFDCGQCFRWEEAEDGSFFGVAGGYWGKFEYCDEGIKLTTDCENEGFWREYLDLDRDYGEIKKAVSVNELMENAVRYGSGIRILKQEFFETLMSFIISQRSSIPKIKSSVKKLCEKYGKKITIDGKTYHSFPSCKDLVSVTEDDFRDLGVGYRAPYLVRCVEDVCLGKISEEELMSLPTEKAREKLISLYGVGDKVCDCVMLFALKKYDLFPSDVWIKRVMCENFGSEEKTAKTDGEKLFGPLSGFAQQYLFYYRRNMEEA